MVVGAEAHPPAKGAGRVGQPELGIPCEGLGQPPPSFIPAGAIVCRRSAAGVLTAITPRCVEIGWCTQGDDL